MDTATVKSSPPSSQSGVPGGPAGEAAAVSRTRALHAAWRRNAIRQGWFDASLVVISLLASGAVAAFNAHLAPWAVATLGFAAFAGTGVRAALRPARKADTYWRAWRTLNHALLRYDAGKVSFLRLIGAQEQAEHFYEGWDDVRDESNGGGREESGKAKPAE